MFKILLVEDTTEKLKNIVQALTQIDGIELGQIENVLDAVSAKRLLKNNHYDLMILDIAIPTALNKDIDMEGGIKFLEEITTRDRYHTPTHVIGLTGVESVLKTAQEKFEKVLISVIKYDEASVEWETNLINGVKQFISAKSSVETQDNDYNYDVAIVCALQEELDSNLKNGWKWEEKQFTNDDSIYYEYYFVDELGKQRKVIASRAARMGMPAVASLTSKIIQKFKPRIVIMTGIMAGVSKRVELGDIVIPCPVWDWGSGKWVPDPGNSEEGKHSLFQIDPYQFTVDGRILKHIEHFKKDNQFLFELRKGYPGSGPKKDTNIHIGPAASGASVLGDKNLFQNIINQHRKLLGVEMEAYGLFSAIETACRPKPIGICIKSVVDYGDDEKDDNYHPYGSYLSAEIAKHLINKLIENNDI